MRAVVDGGWLRLVVPWLGVGRREPAPRPCHGPAVAIRWWWSFRRLCVVVINRHSLCTAP
jgi:hypothetical protein